MKRKLIKTILSLIVLSLIWFLFIKKYDYQINFLAKTSPGTVYSRILALENKNITKQEKDIKVINKTAFKSVDLQSNLKDSTSQFHWELKPVNDSVTKVSVFVIDNHHSLKQRLLLLIGKSDFVKNSIRFVSDFNKALDDHLEKFRVKIDGKSERPAFQSVIYVTFSTDLPSKASEMIKNIYYLTEYMREHNIKKAGNPFMNIINWNREQNTLNAQFCFPVETLAQYPTDTIVKTESLKAQPALKAVFHGNYKYTDRAWFALINYAQLHNYNVQNKILEIYYDDPHNDPDELKWKADVYMPLKD